MARGEPLTLKATVRRASIARRGARFLATATILALLATLAAAAYGDETAWTKAPWDTPAFRLPLPVERLQGNGGAAAADVEAAAATAASSPAPPSSLAGPAGLWAAPRPPLDDAGAPSPAPPAWAAAHTAAVAAAPALACDVCLALAERAWAAGVAWVGTEGGVPPAPHRVARHMRASCDGGTGPPGGATPLGPAPKAALAGAGVAAVGDDEVEGQGVRYVRYARPAPPTSPLAPPPPPPTRLEVDAARQACLTLTDGAAPPLPGPGAGGGGAAYAHPGPPAAAVLGSATPLPPAAAAVADALSALARRTTAAYAAVGRPPPRGKVRGAYHPLRSSGSSLGAAASTCADLHPECAAWAARGECERNVRYMVGDLALDGDRPLSRVGGEHGGGGGAHHQQQWRGHCRLSCGLCAPGPDALPPPLEGEAGAGLATAAASLKAAALLRACVAAPPCGGSTADAAVAKAALAAVAGGAGLAATHPAEAGAAAAAAAAPPTAPARRRRPGRDDPPVQRRTGPPLALGPFAGKCFLIPAGYWTFEVCPGVSARQARLVLGGGGSEEDAASVPSHSLGVSTGAVERGAVRDLPPADVPPGLAGVGAAPVRFVSERFAGGDECEPEVEGVGEKKTTVRRSAELRLACPPDGIVRATVAEPETCTYVLTLFHPDACELTGGGGVGGGGGGRGGVAVAEEDLIEADDAAASLDPPPPALSDEDGLLAPLPEDAADSIPALPAEEEDEPTLPLPPLRDEL